MDSEDKFYNFYNYSFVEHFGVVAEEEKEDNEVGREEVEWDDGDNNNFICYLPFFLLLLQLLLQLFCSMAVIYERYCVNLPIRSAQSDSFVCCNCDNTNR